MASTIKLKRGSGAPGAGALVEGEPAFDLTNKRLYTENSGGTVIEVGTNPTTITIPAGTIDNTVIGGTTTAAGSFTTLQADTSLNVDGTVTTNGLTSDGNVGIGATAPSQLLHIKSTAGTDGPYLRLERPDSGSEGTIYIGAESAVNTIYSQGDGNAAKDLRVVVGNSTEAMRITSAGRVIFGDPDGDISGLVFTGLATTDPVINTNATGAEFVAYRTDNAVNGGDFIGAYLFGNDDNDATEDHFAGMWAKATGTAGSMDLHFAAGKAGYEADSPQMTIDSSGNVGIGTTAPAEMLEVYNATSPAIQLNDGGDYKSIVRLAGNDLEIRGSSGSMEFYTGAADGDSSTQRMTITSAGDVSIPTGDLTIGSGQADGVILELSNTDSVSNGLQIQLSGNGKDVYFWNHENAAITFATNNEDRMIITSGGALRVGANLTSTITGLNTTDYLMASGGAGGEVVAMRTDDAVAAGDFCGAFVIGNEDLTNTEDHYCGMWAKSTGTSGHMDLHFAAGLGGYEADSAQMTLSSAGKLGIATSAPALDLHVVGADGNAEGVPSFNADSVAVFQNSGSAGDAAIVHIISGTTGNGFLAFGDKDDSIRQTITANQSDGDLKFATGNAALAMTITSGGNTCLGTITTPMQDFGADRTTLALKGRDATDYSVIQMGNGGTSGNDQLHGQLAFYDVHSGSDLRVSAISSLREISTNSSYLTFGTSPGAAGLTEAMRIDRAGNVLIGREIADAATDHGFNVYGTGQLYIYSSSSGDSDVIRGHDASGANTFAIDGDGDYLDLSDERKKENISDMDGGLAEVMQLQPRKFDWIASGEHVASGFIAQEVQEVFPSAVVENDDGFLMMKNKQLIPLLTKALQEAVARIETLEAAVTALQGE